MTFRNPLDGAALAALLPDESVTAAKLATSLASDTYDGGGEGSPGSQGWFLGRGSGYIEANNIRARGHIEATSGTFAGQLSAATGTFAGQLSAATGTFAGQLSAATGTFAGQLSAATGTFAGSVDIGAGGNLVRIDPGIMAVASAPVVRYFTSVANNDYFQTAGGAVEVHPEGVGGGRIFHVTFNSSLSGSAMLLRLPNGALRLGQGARMGGGLWVEGAARVDGLVRGFAFVGRSGGGSASSPTIRTDADWPGVGMYSLAADGEIRWTIHGTLCGLRLRASQSRGDVEITSDVHYPQSTVRQYFDGSGRLGWHAASYAGGSNPIFDIRAEVGGTNYKSFRSLGMSDTASTGAAANVHITGAGNFNVSTSAARFKRDIEAIELDRCRALIRDARPVWYRPSALSTDRKDWSHYGLVAEDVAAIDPRLVHWTHRDGAAAMAEYEDAGEAPPDDELVPGGVQYERLAVFLLPIVREVLDRLDRLEKGRSRGD